MDTRILGFYANVEMLGHKDVFRHFFCRLSKERQQKTEAFKADAGRIHALGAGVLLDYGLRTLYGLSEREAVFAYGAQGKPYLREQAHIHFNLSHSGDYVLAAFAPVELGCDIQQTGQTGRSSRIAARFFTEEERRALAAGVDFYRIWTRKESYLKLTGEGMALDMRSFSVISKQLDMPGGRCHFEDYALPGYALAVCYANAESLPVIWTEVDLKKLQRDEE